MSKQASGYEPAGQSSVRDKAEGMFHEAKGKAREIAGGIADNPKLEAKGNAEKIAGKVQEKVGQVKKFLGK
ncbi:MAG: CsbD family protein [Proteobacteria bacterium]|nr:CsbD family protein [Pseudomonadota bacterium]